MKFFFYLLLFLFYSYPAFSQEIKANEIKNSKMIIYGSDTCHYCVDTKKYADEQNLKFVYFDIDKDEKALNEMLIKLRKNNISTANLNLPVVDKNGLVFTNEVDFDAFLKKLN